MPEKNKIEIRSGEVQEILGGVPSWIVRYGILLFIVIFSILISFSFMFRYPDILRSKIVVTTENPPATIIARATGKIDSLFVVDNQKIEKGQIIAVIEASAEFNDVLNLESLLIKVQPALDTLDFSLMKGFNSTLQLGTLQELYSVLLTKNKELELFTSQNYFQQLNVQLDEQISMSNQLYDRQFQQKEAVRKEFEIKENNYLRQRKLLASEVSSNLELEKVTSEKHAKEAELNGLRSRLSQEKINISNLRTKKIENNKAYEELKNQHESALLEAFNNLKSAVINWKLTYLMTSPIEGTITFNKFWSDNQNISEGDKAFTVVPDDLGETIGKVELPVRGSGKVKPDFTVIVKFDNFPYIEYGMVRGQVKNVSLVQEDNFYTVDVTFPNGLTTNYGNNLEMQNQLTGQAEIITEDLKLIQRFFNPLKALWKERVKN